MTGKVYVVTGASRGIGLEFVKQIIEEKDIVFACARNLSSSKELVDLATKNKDKVIPITLDTTNLDTINAAASEITERAPDGIDVLINNAGIGSTLDYNIETVPQEEFTRVINTNVIGVSNVTQRFIPLLRKRGEQQVKKIINISSIIGSITSMDGSRGSGQGPVYGISKTALNMLTRLTANHLRSENFIVFAIHPGWVSTDLGGQSAPVTSQESVRGILNKIDQCQSKDSGEFFDFTGASLEW
ncbi:hypothetical protein HMPREF1544_05380 [Mucor circinelloides 1006PhL]|uniref:Uncharacterized protein n=1 Tax=Mucor circinelloides f. circinelloides (strain 1006PhL) TaxID=1220926 RepID=S2JC66_MUCC1|nr:hypothetical protein HMPREF1544_05380 [Mucor circinelloides 1006PhL]KAG1090386.1 hypothetical protein G6F42_019708 [Rhizopus arrhizus]